MPAFLLLGAFRPWRTFVWLPVVPGSSNPVYQRRCENYYLRGLGSVKAFLLERNPLWIFAVSWQGMGKSLTQESMHGRSFLNLPHLTYWCLSPKHCQVRQKACCITCTHPQALRPICTHIWEGCPPSNRLLLSSADKVDEGISVNGKSPGAECSLEMWVFRYLQIVRDVRVLSSLFSLLSSEW